MRVELLWWDGCPSYDAALTELQEVLREEGLDASRIEVREVPTDADAEREQFVGSPTIRIGGREVAPEPGEPAGLTCRVYHRRDGRVSPTPDPEDIRAVLKEAAR
jgi:hypothetical protein